MNEETVKAVVCSIELYLNPKVFSDKDKVRSINEALVAERPVVIRNALLEAFAERVFQCLDQSNGWRLYEEYEEHFHFHHHNLYEKKAGLYPPDLFWCDSVFASEPTKKFMQGLSRRDCSGATVISASWYLPGDHSLPHNDCASDGENEFRQLAFVWYLTKNWQPSWGGHFYWCEAMDSVPPAFNTLILFTVHRKSVHFVTHVTPYAQAKRLAVSGWWTGKEPNTAPRERRGEPDGDQRSFVMI